MSGFTVKEAVIGLGALFFATIAFAYNWQVEQDKAMQTFQLQIQKQQLLNDHLRETQRLLSGADVVTPMADRHEVETTPRIIDSAEDQ